MTISENFTIERFEGELGLNDAHMLAGQYKRAVPLDERGLRPVPEVKEILEEHASPDEEHKTLMLVRNAASQNVVGAALLHFVDEGPSRAARITEIFTDSRVRAKKAGSQLLDACIVEALDVGVQFVDLVNPPLNEAAEQLFKNRDFVPHEDDALRLDLADRQLDSDQ